MPSQVISPADLALGAGGRLVEACIGLAVPGRQIGPWPRRTGAPEASATGRDRNPDAHEIAHGTRRNTRDERVQDGMMLRRPPSSMA
jgi:hypothetical protein